jgi:hypothetical protein
MAPVGAMACLQCCTMATASSSEKADKKCFISSASTCGVCVCVSVCVRVRMVVLRHMVHVWWRDNKLLTRHQVA